MTDFQDLAQRLLRGQSSTPQTQMQGLHYGKSGSSIAFTLAQPFSPPPLWQAPPPPRVARPKVVARA
eukprot:scaffold40195_cov146-Isochrysis_galbana.AAC.1